MTFQDDLRQDNLVLCNPHELGETVTYIACGAASNRPASPESFQCLANVDRHPMGRVFMDDGRGLGEEILVCLFSEGTGALACSPEAGDKVVLTGNVTYTVTEIHPDGFGMYELTARRVARKDFGAARDRFANEGK